MSELTPLALPTNPEMIAMFQRRQAEIQQSVSKLQQTYSDYTESELRQILHLTVEYEACKRCKGLPCQKKIGKHIRLFDIERDEFGIYPRTGTCEFRRAQMIQAGTDRLLKSSRIPKRYFGKTMADYEATKGNQDALFWAIRAVDNQQGAFLHGERGTGKTFLASIVAQQFMNQGLSTVFIKVPALLNELMSAIQDPNRTTDQVYKELDDVKLLVLDDFGMEKPTKFAGSALCQIIDSRYDRAATTIITSNYDLNQIEHELNNASDGKSYNGSRIVDRIKSLCPPIKLHGTSRR